MVQLSAACLRDLDAEPIRSLALRDIDDDPNIRHKYRPFILNDGDAPGDWIDLLELNTAIDMAEEDLQLTGQRLKILVLYGSLRRRRVDPQSSSLLCLTTFTGPTLAW